MSEWKYWTPEYDGHCPHDWDGGRVDLMCLDGWTRATPNWDSQCRYRYLPAPIEDAKYEPDLLAMCRALPKDQQEALIAELQKPVRDWADAVWEDAYKAHWACGKPVGDGGYRLDPEDSEKANIAAAAVIRSLCRPKDFEISDEAIANAWGKMLRANGPEQMHKIFREALS